MDTYVILRRNGSRTAEDLEEAAAHTIHRRRFAATQVPRRFGGRT